MKLLFDENLSPSLPRRVGDLFPNSVHVRDIGMKSSDDLMVWDYAKENDFMVVSKDPGYARPQLGVRKPAQNYLAATWELLNTTSGRSLTAGFCRYQAVLRRPERIDACLDVTGLTQSSTGILAIASRSANLLVASGDAVETIEAEIENISGRYHSWFGLR